MTDRDPITSKFIPISEFTPAEFLTADYDASILDCKAPWGNFTSPAGFREKLGTESRSHYV